MCFCDWLHVTWLKEHLQPYKKDVAKNRYLLGFCNWFLIRFMHLFPYTNVLSLSDLNQVTCF